MAESRLVDLNCPLVPTVSNSGWFQVAKLKAEARVDKRVYLKREYSKERWGVSLTYTFR